MNEEWLIWSNEHGAWWRAGESGYTKSKQNAGRYSFEKACQIVERANMYVPDDQIPKEAMIKSL